MPRKNRRNRRRRRAPRPRARRAQPAAAAPASIPHEALQALSTHLKAAASRPDTPETLGLEEKKSPAAAALDPAITALRSVFKADIPYRTRIGFSTSFSATGGTAINVTFNNATLNTTPEWSSIDALFDEVFIHSMHVRYQPINTLGGGQGISASSIIAAQPGSTTGGTTVTTQYAWNTPLVIVALFHGGATYSTASAMESNPTKRHTHTGSAWTYMWRNNTRFDARGAGLSPLTSINWQGWTLVSEVGFYGGQIQVRAVNDQVLGNGAGTITLGTAAVTWDVSFRARA